LKKNTIFSLTFDHLKLTTDYMFATLWEREVW